MVELTEAFVGALTRAGVHAAAAMPPETAPRLKAPAVGVSAAEVETSPGGFSAYLGVQDGRELSGLRSISSIRACPLAEITAPHKHTSEPSAVNLTPYAIFPVGIAASLAHASQIRASIA